MSHAISSLLGSVGVVIWGSSKSMTSHQLCQGLNNYTTTEFGPFVRNFTLWASNCSRTRCSGHGQCITNEIPQLLELLTSSRDGSGPEKVGKEAERLYKGVLTAITGERRGEGLGESFTCKCFAGWSGDTCSKSSSITA